MTLLIFCALGALCWWGVLALWPYSLIVLVPLVIVAVMLGAKWYTLRKLRTMADGVARRELDEIGPEWPYAGEHAKEEG